MIFEREATGTFASISMGSLCLKYKNHRMIAPKIYATVVALIKPDVEFTSPTDVRSKGETNTSP